MLRFGNSGRSYDPVLRRIHFVGHDDEKEIPFAVDVSALKVVQSKDSVSEKLYLKAFDKKRRTINEVAREAYCNCEKTIYLLTSVDFR
ncbi:DUF1488 family protein [Rhizobiales bacterium]|uniref:DUF1488 family protein n=1 Tax=Hongsoonwoonella zoysiae TaxID=2821844 RepID=UPI00155F8DF7|nr:DUF1488 family protein [Hongsoonwoonella zoysiae]